MKETFAPFDAAHYLTSEKEIAAYLNVCIEDYGDDPAFIAHALGTVARAQGMAKLARKMGVGRESLYKSLSTNGNPELATVLKLLSALGIKMKFAKA